MSIKRVLLIESGQFLGGVIGSLFSCQDQIHLIEASPSTGAELVQAVKQHTPQIVVLDDTLHSQFLSDLLRYMRKTDGLRVVVVGADSNHVEVYQKTQVPVMQNADFFAIL